LAAKPFVEIQRNEFITLNFSARLFPSTSWAISRLPISEFGLKIRLAGCGNPTFVNIVSKDEPKSEKASVLRLVFKPPKKFTGRAA
jgi:hypothetical protein